MNEERDAAQRAEQALLALKRSPTANSIEALQAARMAAEQASEGSLLSNEAGLNNARAEVKLKLGALQEELATGHLELPIKIDAALAAVRDWKNRLRP